MDATFQPHPARSVRDRDETVEAEADALARATVLLENLTGSLVSACVNGHDKVVTTLLTHVNVDAVDDEGRTVLIRAIRAMNKSSPMTCIHSIIEKSDDIDHWGEDDRTALYWACRRGLHEWVLALLKAGADAEPEGCLGPYPLCVAAREGHAECVRVLVESESIDVDWYSQQKTALMFACQNGHSACVHILINAGASVAACVQILINAVASVDEDDLQGDTALCFACRRYNEMVDGGLLTNDTSVRKCIECVCALLEALPLQSIPERHAREFATVLHRGRALNRWRRIARMCRCCIVPLVRLHRESCERVWALGGAGYQECKRRRVDESGSMRP